MASALVAQSFSSSRLQPTSSSRSLMARKLRWANRSETSRKHWRRRRTGSVTYNMLVCPLLATAIGPCIKRRSRFSYTYS